MPLIRVPIGADGPVIDLGIWIGRAAAHGLIAAGGVVRQPQAIRALIDTGANMSGIHPNVLTSDSPSGASRLRRPNRPGSRSKSPRSSPPIPASSP
jgi:hypothetical protein